MVIVYGLSSSDEPHRIRYVGQTTKSPLTRLWGHLRGARRSDKNEPRTNWIRKHLALGHEIVITILEVDATINQDEILWIAKVQPDLNCTRGGEAGCSKMSDATKLKISASLKGRPKSLEIRKKISQGSLGKVISQETKEKMSASHRGQKRRAA